MRNNVFITIFTLAFVVGCNSGCAGTSPAVRTPNEIDHISHAVVALIAPTDPLEEETGPHQIYCTGTFVSPVHVLTAAHCIDVEGTVVIDRPIRVGTYNDYVNTRGTFENNSWRRFRVISAEPHNDLALLRLDRRSSEHSDFPHTELRVTTRDNLQGEYVVSVGHPRGLGWTMTYGIISSELRRGEIGEIEPGAGATNYVQTSAQAYYGNSGGPLLNSNNEIIGVCSRGGPWHIVMSIHASTIRNFLDSNISCGPTHCYTENVSSTSACTAPESNSCEDIEATSETILSESTNENDTTFNRVIMRRTNFHLVR